MSQYKYKYKYKCIVITAIHRHLLSMLCNTEQNDYVKEILSL